MFNIIIANFGANYKMKVERMTTQPLNYVTNWQCTN